MAATIGVREMLYEETFAGTGVVDFGIDMASALSGAKPIPPGGVRVDFAFEGAVKGPRLAGTIKGTDYLCVTDRGLGRLDVRAVITTDDGARIEFRADGVAQVAGPVARLRENVRLQTSAPAYAWVNSVQIWATGESDLATGVGRLTGYVA